MLKRNSQPILQLRRSAQAKLNLSLSVLGKRADGYHNLQSIMQTVDLHDEVSLSFYPVTALTHDRTEQPGSPVFGRLEISCSNPSIAADETNLAYRAAKIWLEHYGLKADLHIHLHKRIPFGAGLGGGSSNAAAVLRGLTQAYQSSAADAVFAGPQGRAVEPADLIRLGARIGADVPFCLVGGTVYCEGIGEIMTPLDSFAGQSLLICKPPFEVITREAFAWLDRADAADSGRSHGGRLTPDQLNDLLARPLQSIDQQLQNDFFAYVSQYLPELNSLCAYLRRTGSPFVRMTGSGPSLFAVYDCADRRDRAYRDLLDRAGHSADKPDLTDYFIVPAETADALD